MKIRQPKALRGRKVVHTSMRVGEAGTLYVFTLDNGDVWTKLCFSWCGVLKARWRCAFRALPPEGVTCETDR